ncbi:hypothetical protein GGF50DRAFT_32126, partial [Schizophyllum commune]
RLRQRSPSPPARNQTPRPLHCDRALPAGRGAYTEGDVDTITFGSMSIECRHCHALHWAAERVKSSPEASPSFGRCCKHGKVVLPRMPALPHHLLHLFTDQDLRGREFRHNVRQYNAALAFTSLGVRIDDSINTSGSAPYIFKIGGELCHRMGALLPSEGNQPRYTQLYIYDPRDALDARMARNDNLSAATMHILQRTLLLCNPYTRIYRHAADVLTHSSQAPDVHLTLCVDAQQDPHRYNLPTADELAAILPASNAHASDGRDIVVYLRDGRLRRINDCSPAYAPLHYVLFFPFGTPGW